MSMSKSKLSGREGMTERGADDSRDCGKKLGEGARVEVRLIEKGLRGSWHPAIVLKSRPGRRVVEYEELLRDEREGEKLKETISVGKGLDGVRTSCRKPGQTPTKDRLLLRPRPPEVSYPPRSSWTKGLWVDVFWRDSWWEGILLETITPGKESVRVYFPDEGGVEVYCLKDVRIRQEWDEETGLWSVKGSKSLGAPKSKEHSSKNKDCTPQKLDFSKTLPDSAQTKLKSTETETKWSLKNLKLVKVESENWSGKLLSTDLERSKLKQCLRKGAVGTSLHPPPPMSSSDLLKRLDRSGIGKADLKVQERNCQKKQVPLPRMPMQEEEAESPPSFCDGKEGNCRSPHLQNGQGPCLIQKSRVGIYKMEDNVDTAMAAESKWRQIVNKDSRLTISEIIAKLNSSRRPQQETVRLDKARFVHLRDKRCSEENVPMVIDEKTPPRIPAVRVPNCIETSQVGNASEKGGAAFRHRQNRSAGKLNGLEHSEQNIIDSIQQREKVCKKRSSSSHCGLDADFKTKKSRGGYTDEVAPPAAVTGPHFSQDEGSRSNKNLGHHKDSPTQERTGNKNGVRGGCRMEVLLSAPGDPAFGEGRNGAGTNNARKNLLSWLIAAGALVKDQKLIYLHKGKKDLGHGWVTAEGVLCGCCSEILTLSNFEAHCGSKLHRPCANIFVHDGKSLTDLQMEVFKKENESVRLDAFSSSKGAGRRRRPQKLKKMDVSDDTCGVCGDGGMLVCCDHCPSTFHLACMELEAVPPDDWYCPNCRCAICGKSHFNGSQTSFNEMTILFCDQCEREFHVKCLYDRGFPKMDECPQDSWFCGQACEKIYNGLRGLVGATNNLEEGYSWTVLRSQAEDSEPKSETDKELMAEHNIKLSIALSVMQECFRPMIDPRTKVDLVAHVLYNRGSDVNRLNYRGFYTMILEKGDELISVAAIRVHGAVLAEMPLIGTRYQYRRQGMCRRLMHAIEQMLQLVGVESLVLPAVPELLETWTGAFGFQPLDSPQRRELIELNLMAFPGTSLLRKFLPRWQTQAAFGGILQLLSGKVQDNLRESESGRASITNAKWFESSRPKDHMHNSHASSAMDAMVSVPVGGPAFGSCQDFASFPKGDLIQSYLAQVKEAAKRHRKVGSVSPASTPSPREVVMKRDLNLQQRNGYHGDRHRENGNNPNQSEENLYSAKVVVGTTRSKRLVKATRWVADAVNKLTGRSSSAQAETCCPGNVPADRQPTPNDSDILCTVHRKERPSGTDVKPSVDFPQPETSKKLIIRIKLPKLTQKGEKKKKKKKHRHHRDKRSSLESGPNAGLLSSTPTTIQQPDFGDDILGKDTLFRLCNSQTPSNSSSPMFLPSTCLQPTPFQVWDGDDLEYTTIIPEQEFLSVPATTSGWVSESGMKRLGTPGVGLVEIVPALDIGHHLLPMLRQRSHMLQLLPAT